MSLLRHEHDVALPCHDAEMAPVERQHAPPTPFSAGNDRRICEPKGQIDVALNEAADAREVLLTAI